MTVISQEVDVLQYSRSLCKRLHQAGCPTLLLSVQYQCILRLGILLQDFSVKIDYVTVRVLPGDLKKFLCKVSLLRSHLFYNVTHGRGSHRHGSVSYQNIHETQFALQLYELLQRVTKLAGANHSAGCGGERCAGSSVLCDYSQVEYDCGSHSFSQCGRWFAQILPYQNMDWCLVKAGVQVGDNAKSNEDKIKEVVFMKDGIPFWVAASGYVGFAAISVRFGKKVTKIQWTDGEVIRSEETMPVYIDVKDGSFMDANHIVITVSLCILKSSTRKTNPALFNPPLPSYKVNSIYNL
ncbi:hypothetical protein KI387_033716, partial [Taxus chinensis]